jgi:hypothetical protein
METFASLILDTTLGGLVAATVRTQDVVILGYETSADKWLVASLAHKAVVVPVTIFEWDVFGAANTLKETEDLSS